MAVLVCAVFGFSMAGNSGGHPRKLRPRMRFSPPESPGGPPEFPPLILFSKYLRGRPGTSQKPLCDGRKRAGDSRPEFPGAAGDFVFLFCYRHQGPEVYGQSFRGAGVSALPPESPVLVAPTVIFSGRL